MGYPKKSTETDFRMVLKLSKSTCHCTLVLHPWLPASQLSRDSCKTMNHSLHGLFLDESGTWAERNEPGNAHKKHHAQPSAHGRASKNTGENQLEN